MADERVIVECVECNELLGTLATRSRHELAALATSLVIACHATQPHCDHALRAIMPQVRADARELTIRCLHSSCAAVEPLQTRCAIELVAAITICFHASHEGHPIEISYDGNSWRSPQSGKHG